MSRHAGMLSTITPPSHPPTAGATATTYAGRTIRQFVRTPQLLVVNAATSMPSAAPGFSLPSVTIAARSFSNPFSDACKAALLKSSVLA